jgi:hydroxyethylthiazole kinase
MDYLSPIALDGALALLRSQRPVVLNLTNFVVMNPTANALIAIGASPIMAHAEAEIGEMTSIASALVINIGTLDETWLPRYRLALSEMRAKGKPVVLDPVGAGASRLRSQTCLDLLESEGISVLRGNASEILALAGAAQSTKGVDATVSSEAAIKAAVLLYQRYGATVCISGAVDYIVDDAVVATLTGGHPYMPLVTGTGCTASALCGAFLAGGSQPAAAATQAMACMALAGEQAGALSQGPGTFWPHFLDALYHLDALTLAGRYTESLEAIA